MFGFVVIATILFLFSPTILIERLEELLVTQYIKYILLPTQRSLTLDSATDRCNSKLPQLKLLQQHKQQLLLADFLGVMGVLAVSPLLSHSVPRRGLEWMTCGGSVYLDSLLLKGGDLITIESLSKKLLAGLRFTCTELFKYLMKFFILCQLVTGGLGTVTNKFSLKLSNDEGGFVSGTIGSCYTCDQAEILFICTTYNLVPSFCSRGPTIKLAGVP
jgi:hypothetical protein